MPVISLTNIGGVNQYQNPLNKDQGELLYGLNVDSFPLGAKSKRTGYGTAFGTADGSAVNSLFQFIKNDGTTNFLYRASGNKLYYYNEGAGTGDWTVCGNGTITAGAHVDYAVLDNTLIVCDGAGSTRHTTDGVSFTNTTLAPIAVSLEQYQNRIYAAGTSSTLFYSTTGDATNWNTSGTSDSSSLKIPGGGKLGKIFKQGDRLIAPKTTGAIFKWDGYALIDTATTLGPSSPYSVSKIEDFVFSLNRLGIYGFGGGRPQLLSNPVQRQIYNTAGSGIAGTVFDSAPGAAHRFDYLVAVGSVTDDLTNITTPNAIIKYDYQKNEFLDWSFAHPPTAMMSYKDRSGVQQFLFGNSTGQCFKTVGSATTDNGTPISSKMIFVIHGGSPHLEKKWNHFWALLNPGCEAQIRVAYANTYSKQSLRWIELGDAPTGVLYSRLPNDPDTGQSPRSRLLFVEVYDSSITSQYSLYGLFVDADPMAVY